MYRGTEFAVSQAHRSHLYQVATPGRPRVFGGAVGAEGPRVCQVQHRLPLHPQLHLYQEVTPGKSRICGCVGRAEGPRVCQVQHRLPLHPQLHPSEPQLAGAQGGAAHPGVRAAHRCAVRRRRRRSSAPRHEAAVSAQAWSARGASMSSPSTTAAALLRHEQALSSWHGAKAGVLQHGRAGYACCNGDTASGPPWPLREPDVCSSKDAAVSPARLASSRMCVTTKIGQPDVCYNKDRASSRMCASSRMVSVVVDWVQHGPSFVVCGWDVQGRDV